MTQKVYTKNGEWVLINNNQATCGLSCWAVEQLGEVSFVELPCLNDATNPLKPAGTIEAVKAASDYFIPVTGMVKEVNERLVNDPQLLQTDPEGEGWICRVSIHELDLSDLMTEHEFASWTRQNDA